MLLVNVTVAPQTRFGVQPKFRWGASTWRAPLQLGVGVWPPQHAKLGEIPRRERETDPKLKLGSLLSLGMICLRSLRTMKLSEIQTWLNGTIYLARKNRQIKKISSWLKHNRRCPQTPWKNFRHLTPESLSDIFFTWRSMRAPWPGNRWSPESASA